MLVGPLDGELAADVVIPGEDGVNTTERNEGPVRIGCSHVVSFDFGTADGTRAGVATLAVVLQRDRGFNTVEVDC